MDLDELLTVSQIAAWLKVRPDTVRAWIAWGELRATDIGTAKAHRYRITRRAVLEKMKVVRGCDLTTTAAAKGPAR